MKKTLTTLLLLLTGSSALFSQATPEVLYYKFDGSGTSVPNYASAPPVGTATATLMGGITQGSTGQCHGAVIGSGVSSTTDYVNTGWAPNLGTGSWTISFWSGNITPSATLFYIFGDLNTASMRCFTNGVAGANNWILRGGGMTDVLVTGGATVAPHVTTFVYDNTLNNIKAYLDGVLVNTVAQTAPNLTGTGPFKVVGYSANVGAPVGGMLDEFRVYSRAITPAEVLQLQVPPTVYSSFAASGCFSYTVPSGNATYTSAGIYNDTIPAILGCGDSVMTITVSINNTSSAFSVNACNSYTVPSGAATYTLNGTYNDTIPNAVGCDSVMTITVNINANPTVTATAATPSVCLGSSDVLTAGGAVNYAWSSGGTTATETVSPTTMTTYTVTGTDVNGCSNTATVMVMVDALPVVNLGSDPTACGNILLDATNSNLTYLWSDNSTASTLNVTATGTYMVTVADMNGCMNADTINVTINSLPVVTLGADVTQCEGTITFDAQNVGSTYLWSDASTGQTLTVSASGTVVAIVTDANGCMNSDTVVATINSNPIVNLGNDITQCGGSYLFDAQNVGSTYLWNDATNGQTIVAYASGTFYVDVTDANGCVGSDTVVATLNTNPTVTGTASSTSVCLNDAAVSLTGTPAGGSWTGPGVTGASFSPMTAGAGVQSVVYSYTDANGCFNSATVAITVNACVGIVEQTFINGVNVYPNPNNGVFILSVNANVADMQIEITDLQGRVVYSSMENNITAGYMKEINLQNESAGIYLMRITGNGEQLVEKISLQK